MAQIDLDMKVQLKEKMYDFLPGVTYKAKPIFADGRQMVQVNLPHSRICIRTDWANVIVVE